MITLTANVAGQDLGRTVGQVDAAIARAGAPPRGAAVAVRGQIGAMRETFTNITAGLVVAVVVIFLLLAANFQSLRLALVVISTVPAVLTGVVLMLRADAHHAERAVVHGRHHGDRRRGGERDSAGDVCGAGARARPARRCRRRSRRRARACGPVLMTSAAMMAGMLPMALASAKARRRRRRWGAP